MSLIEKVRYLRNQEAFRAEPLRVLARLGWWGVRCRVPRPASVRLRRWEITLELLPRWRGVAKLAYAFRDRYEPELDVLGGLVRPGSVAVDVGVNYGIYTCVLARLVGATGHVYAFEPASEAAAVLRRNVARNGLAWVEVIQGACADFSGEAVLAHEPDPGRNWLATGPGPASGTEPVQVVRLDEVVGDASFVKVDVEGAEELVLRGAADLLRRSRPAVLFEVNPEAARWGGSPHGAWRLLAELAYRFFRAAPGSGLVPITAPPPGGNVVALPAERASEVQDWGASG